MSMTALVESTPSFTREEAAHALSGNLCRCADYQKILNCAMRAGELARARA
jgi:aerobic-type carbon monoxide dehydrogenase small subunit (CoxS/CutS family)